MCEDIVSEIIKKKDLNGITDDVVKSLDDLKPVINELKNEIEKMEEYRKNVLKILVQKLNNSSKGLYEQVQKTKNIISDCSEMFNF